MTIEKIIASLEKQMQEKDQLSGGDPDSIFTKEATALYEAIRMLRAKQINAKLDRSRWEGCEFCNGRYCSDCYWWLHDLCKNKCSSCIDKSNWKPLVAYCSSCGKPLIEEAWEELERRINDETND